MEKLEKEIQSLKKTEFVSLGDSNQPHHKHNIFRLRNDEKLF